MKFLKLILIALTVTGVVVIQLESELGESIGYTWSQWHKKAVEGMEKEFLESTIQEYEFRILKWIDPYFNDKDLGSITDDDVHNLIFDYIPSIGGTPWTQKNLYKKIHRIFEIAVNKRVLSRNPAKGIRVQTPEFTATALRDDEMTKLFSEAKNRNHPFYPHWIAAALTGMRNGELYILSWDKVKLKHDFIDVNEQFTKKDGIHLPKKNRIRVVDLHPLLKKFFLELRDKYGTFEEIMWEWGSWRKAKPGEKIGKTVYQGGEKVRDKVPVLVKNLILPRLNNWRNGMQADELRKFCKQIGITSIKFHDLRASHITNLLENGTPISKVMKHVGHAKLATTDQYNDLSSVKVKGATEKSSFEIPDEASSPDNVISLFGS